MLPLSIFRLRTLAGANAAGLLLGGSFFAFVFVGTLYMQQVLHYSALQSGLAWLAASLTSIALAGVSQWLVTRGGAKIVMAIGMTLIGAGVVWADPGARRRPLPRKPRGPVRRRRGGDRVRVHPDLDRRARRCRRAPGRTRLRAAEHLPATRRCDRDRDRLERRRHPHEDAASRRSGRTCGAHRWIPAGALGAGGDRPDRAARDLRARSPRRAARTPCARPRCASRRRRSQPRTDTQRRPRP